MSTFLELQDEFLHVTGKSGQGAGSIARNRAKQYLNWAYEDVAHYFQHEENRNEETFSTVSGTDRYDLRTTNIHSILYVRDDTNDHELKKWDMNQFNRQPAQSAESWKYARLGSCLYLYPNPNAVVSIRVRNNLNIVPLSADADVSIFQREWDHPILQRAIEKFASVTPGMEKIAAAARVGFTDAATAIVRAAEIESEDLYVQMVPVIVP